MDLDKIELHDAILLNTKLLYPEKIVEITIEYYPEGEKSKSRIKGILTFIGVSQYSDISDFDKIENHAIAGNISYWVPSNNPGTTYIYLARGLLSITAQKIKMKTNV